MPINKNEIIKEKFAITEEMFAKALQCKTIEDLLALAKAEDIELTKEEAEAYLAELNNIELDNEELKQIVGGNECPYRMCNWDCLKDDSYINIV